MKKMPWILLVGLCSCSSEDPAKGDAIDKEISELNHQLTEYRVKEMNLEIQSQPMMFDDWRDYAENMKGAEADEHKVQDIEKRLKELENQKKKS